jgi:WD40 repeat protein
VEALAWSPTGSVLVSGGSDGSVRWWDAQHGKCLVRRQGHEAAVQSLSVRPDGRRLATCGDDNTIQVWDLQSSDMWECGRQWLSIFDIFLAKVARKLE